MRRRRQNGWQRQKVPLNPVVVGVDSDLEEVRGVVAGDWVELGRLASLLDKNALTKLHKLKPEEFQDLTGSLCSRIAAKDAL